MQDEMLERARKHIEMRILMLQQIMMSLRIPVS